MKLMRLNLEFKFETENEITGFFDDFFSLIGFLVSNEKLTFKGKK